MTDPLTTPGTAPNRNTQTKEVFDINMAARLAWQETNVSEMNVVIPIIDQAVAAAPAAIAAGGATKWVSGTAVTQQEVDDGYANWSPTDGQSYRLIAPKTSGENVTDPAADSSGDWVKLSSSGDVSQIFTTDGAVTAGKPAIISAANIAQQVAQSSAESIGAQKELPFGIQVGHRCVLRWNKTRRMGAIAYGDTSLNARVVCGVVLDENDELVPAGSPVQISQSTIATMELFEATDQYMVWSRNTSDNAVNADIFGQASDGSVFLVDTIVGSATEGMVSDYTGAASYATSQDTMLFIYENEDAGRISYNYYGLDSNGDIESKVDGSDWQAGSWETAVSAAYDPDNDIFVTGITTAAGAWDLYMVEATPGASNISSLSSVAIDTGAAYSQHVFYDRGEQKPVAFWRNGSNNGTAVVVTYSGSSLSKGTEQSFSGSDIWNTHLGMESIWLENSSKILNLHQYDRAGGTSPESVGYSLVSFSSGTISSTDTDVLDDTGVTTAGVSLAYLGADIAKAIMTYVANQDGKGYYRIFTEQSTNLNAENFIGLFSESKGDGVDAEVITTGGLCTAVSGLTAGQKYYVQPDATLSLTPSIPEILAGTALSATTIRVGV